LSSTFTIAVQQLDWIWIAGGWTLGVLASFLLLWALFRDRGTHKRRCPKCWYDMSGTPSFTCAECGKTITREDSLHKTRRHWWWASLALVVMLAGVWCGVQPKVRRVGWLALVPNGVLIRGLPHFEDSKGAWWKEWTRRYEGNALSNDEISDFFDLCVGGSPDARPPSSAWVKRYGFWTAAIGARASLAAYRPDEDLEFWNEQAHKLWNIPSNVRLSPRTSNSSSESIVFDVTFDKWWPSQAAGRVRIESKLADVKYQSNSIGNAEWFEILAPHSGDETFELTLHFGYTVKNDFRNWLPLETRTLTIDREGNVLQSQSQWSLPTIEEAGYRKRKDGSR
jgi:hypothetical protein